MAVGPVLFVLAHCPLVRLSLHKGRSTGTQLVRLSYRVHRVIVSTADPWEF